MKACNTIIAGAIAAFLAGPASAQTVTSDRSKPQGGGMHPMSMMSPAERDVSGTGTVKKVDAAKRTVSLRHGPIPAIGWPAMTMDFTVAPEVDLGSVKAGQSVAFTLAEAGGNYTVTSIEPSQ